MDVHELLQQAAQAEQQKAWDQAIQLYTSVLKEAPNNLTAKEKLGWCYSVSNKHDRAIKVFKELATNYPDLAKWPYMIGYQYYAKKLWKEAIEWFEKSLTVNPGYIKVFYRKGYAHCQLNQFREALEALNRCRDLWIELANGDAKDRDRKRYTKATYYLAQLVFENPSKIYGDANTEAIKIIKQALEIEPQNGDYHYFLGKVLFNSGRIENAIHSFLEADKYLPNKDYIQDKLGQAYAKLGRFEEAEKAYRKIPSNFRKDYILRNWGYVQYQSGDCKSAIKTLNKAIEKNRRNHKAHYYLGLCYKSTDQNELAVKELQKAIQLKDKYYSKPYSEAQDLLNEIINQHPEIEKKLKNNSSCTGKIISYFPDKGFGFIKKENGEQIFFHKSDFKNPRNITTDTNVEFQLASCKKGPKAIKIKLIHSHQTVTG